MDYDDVQNAALSALEEHERTKLPSPFAIPVKPFASVRQLPMGEQHDVIVVGLHYDPKSDTYEFVCIADDGVGEIYAVKDEALLGTTLPYGLVPAAAVS